MNTQSLNTNNAYTLCGRKVKTSQGPKGVLCETAIELFVNKKGEHVIERATYLLDSECTMLDFNQSEAMTAEKAKTLWTAYIM